MIVIEGCGAVGEDYVDDGFCAPLVNAARSLPRWNNDLIEWKCVWIEEFSQSYSSH